jgi:hypothetical protein
LHNYLWHPSTNSGNTDCRYLVGKIIIYAIPYRYNKMALGHLAYNIYVGDANKNNILSFSPPYFTFTD